MPQHDRERNFEEALSRHFRAACPDAETLAAYHECALASDEMLACKRHISSCSACQEIVVQLEASEHVAMQSETTRDLAKEAKSSSVRVREMPRRAAAWRWAAPAGAIAAGLLVWVTLREMNHPAFIPEQPAPMAAQNVPANSPANSSLGALKKSAPAEAPSIKTPESLAHEAKPQVERGKSANEIAAAKALAKAAMQEATRSRAKVSERRGEHVASSPARAAPKERAIPSVSDSVSGNASAPPAEKQRMVTGAAARAPTVPAGAPATEGLQDQGKGVVGGAAGKLLAPQTAKTELSSNYRQNSVLRALDVGAMHLVATPDENTLWRIGEHGTILRSVDKGTHWQAQTSGVTAAFSFGSAPTKTTCWVVGQNGTILRTVDGGAHWRKISSPISSDLGGVRASDALHAKIWDVVRGRSYETSDGGATWREVPAE